MHTINHDIVIFTHANIITLQANHAVLIKIGY